MRTIEEMIERAIERIVFDYTSKFGIKNLKCIDAYWATLQAYEAIFGKDTYDHILSEVEKRIPQE